MSDNINNSYDKNHSNKDGKRLIDKSVLIKVLIAALAMAGLSITPADIAVGPIDEVLYLILNLYLTRNGIFKKK